MSTKNPSANARRNDSRTQVPRMLSKEEIELLRREAAAADESAKAFFAKRKNDASVRGLS